MVGTNLASKLGGFGMKGTTGFGGTDAPST